MEEKRQPFDSAQDKPAPALQKVSCYALSLRRRTLQLPGLQYTSAVNQALRIWHPVTHSKLDLAPLQVERAEGVYLYTKDGEKILDAISSWWVNLYGQANPRIVAAIAEPACRLEHLILAGFGAAFEKVVAGGGGVVLRVACVLH